MPQMPRAAMPVAEITAFPETPAMKRRRELGECRTHADALALAHSLICDLERAEKSTRRRSRRDPHQLAFPWARAE